MSILVSRNGLLAVARCDDLLLAIAPARDWGDDDWTDHMRQTQQMRDKLGSATTVLTYTPYNAPSVSQRRITADWAPRIGVADARCQVVVSESTMARAALTAMKWVIRPPFDFLPIPLRRLPETIPTLQRYGHFDPQTAFETLIEGLDAVGARAEVLKLKQVFGSTFDVLRRAI
jgi:hypothetical protein